MTTSTPDSDFQWKQEFNDLLEKIASTDEVDTDWSLLRNVIKYKLEQNIKSFLTTTKEPPVPAPFLPTSLISGGLRLPPFPPKKLIHMHLYNPPVSYMNEEQAKEAKGHIFDQLNEFESNPPFTIQRLCELLLQPQKNYKSVGKYLRAIERTVLVTSTQDTFPIPEESASTTFPSNATINVNIPTTPVFATRSTPTTPLFSPIPFLHEDARRSKSRSPPPMTPLILGADPNLPVINSNDPSFKVLGLVDELDDPSPGHMSEHPTPLTVAGGAKPFLGSLEQRFVKSEGDAMDVSGEGEVGGIVLGQRKDGEEGSDSMFLDEDKENAKS